jgi:hypothetical protein
MPGHLEGVERVADDVLHGPGWPAGQRQQHAVVYPIEL